ncbi:MAG: PAS domain S-box protein, partial [Bdellovibrionales bacterium]|nr:PAS domain S-box protein [Bdellovibrionales bacterium]
MNSSSLGSNATQVNSNEARTLLNSLGLLVCQVDSNLTIHWASTAFFNLFCSTKVGADLLTHSLYDFLAGPADFVWPYKGAISDQSYPIEPAELLMTLANGSERWIQWRVCFDDRISDTILLLGIDIDDRHRTEEQLRASQAFLDSVVDNIPNMIFIKEATSLTFVRLNKAGEELLGLSADTVIGKSDRDFFPESQAEFFLSKDREVLQGEEILEILEEPIKTARGETKILHTKKIPLKDSAGKAQYLLGISEDITSRKEFEEALAVSEERLNLAIDGAELGLWDWNVQTGEVVFNDRWIEMLGYSREDLDPHYSTWAKLLNPEDQPRCVSELEKHLKGEIEIYRAEFRLRTKVGKWKWILSVGKVFERDSENLPLRAVGIHLDIDERKQVEANWLKAKEAAESASRLKSEFLANVSHEIRTPMNGVIGMTELLLETNLSPEQKELAQAVQVSADSLLNIINDILDFSKIEAGKLELRPQLFDVRQIVEDLSRLFAQRVKQSGIALETKVDSSLPALVYGDSLRLRQVLINLIGNALKFTGRGGSITLGVEVEFRTKETIVLQFSVVDTGIGISPEDQERIFEPFLQADNTSTRKHGGTGLGLSISARLVALMGGQIAVMSEPGVGSSLIFTADFALSAPEKVIARPSQSVTLHTSRTLDILLVEDNLLNRKLVSTILQKAGHVVEIATNG